MTKAELTTTADENTRYRRGYSRGRVEHLLEKPFKPPFDYWSYRGYAKGWESAMNYDHEKILCGLCAKDITTEFVDPPKLNVYGDPIRYAFDRYIGQPELYPDVWNDQAWLCCVEICKACYEIEGAFDVIPVGKPK